MPEVELTFIFCEMKNKMTSYKIGDNGKFEDCDVPSCCFFFFLLYLSLIYIFLKLQLALASHMLLLTLRASFVYAGGAAI